MFSVVMPVFNKREYVSDTVAAALAQSWRDFELIAVDDGSTDGSLDAVRAFADPRIRILAGANAGPGPARNAGIEAARHEWIAFLDADDLWLPNHLAELDLVRTRHPEAGLIGSGFVICGRDGPAAPPRVNGREIAAIDYFELGNPICTSSSAIARRVYRSLGGFSDTVPGQDSEYMARIALDYPIAVSTRATVVYRLGTGGISDRAVSPWLGKDDSQRGRHRTFDRAAARARPRYRLRADAARDPALYRPQAAMGRPARGAGGRPRHSSRPAAPVPRAAAAPGTG